ncbi:hypothetical protein OKW37_000348 [Paraburkholderia sp. MM5482-R2]
MAQPYELSDSPNERLNGASSPNERDLRVMNDCGCNVSGRYEWEQHRDIRGDAQLAAGTKAHAQLTDQRLGRRNPGNQRRPGHRGTLATGESVLPFPRNARTRPGKHTRVTDAAVELSISFPDFPSGVSSQKSANEHCCHRKRFIEATAGLH